MHIQYTTAVEVETRTMQDYAKAARGHHEGAHQGPCWHSVQYMRHVPAFPYQRWCAPCVCTRVCTYIHVYHYHKLPRNVAVHVFHCVNTRPCRLSLFPPPNRLVQFLVIYRELITNFVLALVAVAVLSMFVLGKVAIVALVCLTVVRRRACLIL